MSPSTSREINGVRPASLSVNKSSRGIHKTHSSSSISSISSTTTTASSSAVHRPQRQQPVIIYTHSPKIIHTEARDFMALVQKLTGLSHSPAVAADEDDSSSVNNNTPPPPPPPSNDNGDKRRDDDSNSFTSENAAAVSPVGFEHLPPPQNSFLPEMPIFTPSSSDFICSSMSFYRYSDPSIFSTSISPFLDVTKAHHTDY